MINKTNEQYIDTDTRFYIDLDLEKQKIIGWGYGQRQELAQKLPDPSHCRIFITKGQYNKLKRVCTVNATAV